jgi:hypothetical protein
MAYARIDARHDPFVAASRSAVKAVPDFVPPQSSNFSASACDPCEGKNCDADSLELSEQGSCNPLQARSAHAPPHLPHRCAGGSPARENYLPPRFPFFFPFFGFLQLVFTLTWDSRSRLFWPVKTTPAFWALWQMSRLLTRRPRLPP